MVIGPRAVSSRRGLEQDGETAIPPASAPAAAAEQPSRNFLRLIFLAIVASPRYRVHARPEKPAPRKPGTLLRVFGPR